MRLAHNALLLGMDPGELAMAGDGRGRRIVLMCAAVA